MGSGGGSAVRDRVVVPSKLGLDVVGGVLQFCRSFCCLDRFAGASFRRESICWSDDSFSFSNFPVSGEIVIANQPSTPPSKDVLALSYLEVDFSSIEPGNTVTVKWHGKPVFVRHRTEEDIKLVNSVDLRFLRNPQEDSTKVRKGPTPYNLEVTDASFLRASLSKLLQ
ncbi:hypothetical protein F0562_004762 [Nyssa sinensis]|uniref:Uncharacterized protein n=1 Tax=Nyssa sinensis TaxID=561372 RepID=A0A5J5AGB4_9ASTE|nr:hypothetical protein F0562_004762 [Nyssa sinensis]